MDRPNFLILGAAKSGTTTLYRLLGQHPDVLLSDAKETRFFDIHYHLGLERYWHDHFGHWRGERAVGEATPIYLTLPFVVPRIRRDLPNAKLIAILRDPAERAYSEWWMLWVRGLERLPFEQAVRENLRQIERGETFEGAEGERRWLENHYAIRRGDRILYRDHIQPGYYADHLERYFALFSRRSVKVLLLEDLGRDPEGMVRDVWAFLGLDPNHPVRPAQDRNAALSPTLAPLMRVAQATGLARVVPHLPEALRARIKRAFSGVGKRPPMDPAVRLELVEHYAPSLVRLERFLGRDLSTWRAPLPPPSMPYAHHSIPIPPEVAQCKQKDA